MRFRDASVLWVALVAGCGYTTRAVAPDGGDIAIFVPLVRDPGLDVDAAGRVDAELRRAVARAAGLRLDEDSSGLRLEVEVVRVDTALAPFAEPGLRAAQYRAVVALRGRLIGGDGVVRWTSAAVHGDAPYLSTGGGIEALDGAGRRALGDAAARAADRLVSALALHLRTGPAKDASR